MIALCDLLQRANWVKRVFFLADRNAMVKQAVNPFKQHMAASSPINLVSEKEEEGRVYIRMRASLPPPCRLLLVPGDVALDEVHQHVGHVLALAGGCGLEGVVQLDWDIQIHSLHLHFLWLADCPHLPSWR